MYIYCDKIYITKFTILTTFILEFKFNILIYLFYSAGDWTKGLVHDRQAFYIDPHSQS
jgi:hypothetical protein